MSTDQHNLAEMDITELVEERFPYDGPHDAESVIDAVRGMTALVRYANNATRNETGLPNAPSVRRVLGHTSEMLASMDQLLDQCGQALDRQQNDPTLTDEKHSSRRGTGAESAQQASTELATARNQLEEVFETLSRARSHVFGLGHDRSE